MEEELEFLFINGEIIAHKPKRQRKELKKILFDRLATPLNIEYYEEIEDINRLEEYTEYHSGAWYPIFDIFDSANKLVDFFIVDNYHIYEWRDDINIDLFKQYCKEYNLKDLLK